MKRPGAPPRATGAKVVLCIMSNTPRLGDPQARFIKPRKPTAITVEGFNSRTDLAPDLIVECADTADMDDGQSLPPFIDDDCAVWRVVRRLPGGRTRWRRIRLSSEHATDRRLVARDYISWRQSRHENHDTKIHARQHEDNGQTRWT